jgi:lipoprotein-anchoring transpeptidase ErfK/SrfK
MTDYVPLLARAIAQLHPNTGEGRRALYDRARKALAEQFRSGDPKWAQADFKTESAALEAAIRRVEMEAARRAAPAQGAQGASAQGAPAYAPADEPHDRPPLKDPRRSVALIGGAVAALALLIAGVAAYTYWPGLPDARSLLKPGPPVQVVAHTPEADNSYVFMRQLVYYRTNYPVGTLIVDKSQTFLYMVRPRLAALRYRIGVGSECRALAGLYNIVRKEEAPGWGAAGQQVANAGDVAVKNPYGARALHLSDDYLIHGTNVALNIDRRELERCIGLINDDVIDLYERTDVGTRVVVLQ